MPYRLRDQWDRWRVTAALRKIWNAPPTPTATTEDAVAEVHMLLCRRDLECGAVALQSILRAIPFPLAVTLTSDGTLSAEERAALTRLAPGARWLDWPSSDPRVVARLREFPQLTQLYRSRYQPSAKLLHPLLASDASRVIVMDPDTVFWRRPAQLCRWIEGSQLSDMYLQDSPRRIPTIPAETIRAFARFVETLPDPRPSWHVENYYFNSGLLAFHRAKMDLSLAERYLAWHSRERHTLNFPQSDIWFGSWTPEQTCYLVMFALQAPPPVPFAEEYMIGASRTATFNHFLRTGLTRSETLTSLQQFIAAGFRAEP